MCKFSYKERYSIFLLFLCANLPLDSSPIRLDLARAIKIGVANNYTLKAVKTQKRIFREVITEKWRDYLPQVGVSVERNRTINNSAQDSISNEVRLNIEQVIYDGGTRELDLDMAKINAQLADKEFLNEYFELKLLIEQAFFNILSNKGKIILNHKSLQRAKLQLKHTKLERKVGFTTDAQVYEVASRVREIELSFQQSKNRYRQALYDLKKELNLDYKAAISIESNLYKDFVLYPPVVNIENLISNARSTRPDIKRLQVVMFQRRKEKEIETNMWKPRISVGGYVGRTGELYPLQERSWGANFTITFPLGNHGFSNAGNLDNTDTGSSLGTGSTSTMDLYSDMGRGRRRLESKLAYGKAIDDYRRLVNGVALEISRDYDSLREKWEEIRIGNGRVFFQFKSLKILQSRYKVGQLKRADIVEAERDLVRAQEDLTDSIAGYIIASYQLQKSSFLDKNKLSLVQNVKGRGNTLIPYLLEDDFSSAEKFIGDNANTTRDSDDIEDLNEDEFLIDKIKLNE